MSGQTTQRDPIGLAGGVNQYGYVGGDPVNFSDPFGLEAYVQCRQLSIPFSAGGNLHCAIRVQNASVDALIELIPQDGYNHVKWRFGSQAAFGASGSVYYAEQWKLVERPAGVSEDEFDRAVLNSAVTVGARFEGRRYQSRGEGNSNRFVYEVLQGAGARPPRGAVPDHFEAPGLCGGKGNKTGEDCKRTP